MTEPESEDLRLVERLCHGEAAAAHELYRRHGAPLLRFGLAVTSSRQTAEDIVHDTFVEFLRNPRRFDPVHGSVGAYLFGIARHQLARALRETLTLVEDVTAAADAHQDAASDAHAGTERVPMEDEVDRTRTIERVRRAVLGLPFAHREVIALCDLVELPYATVATIFDCPIGTVRSRLHRARALLAGELGSMRDSVRSGSGKRNPIEAGSGLRLDVKGTAT